MRELEAVVLETIKELGNEYGVPIRKLAEKKLQHSISIGQFYTATYNLESEGLVRSWEGEPTPERGNRPKRFFSIEQLGEIALLDYRSKDRPLLHTVLAT